MKLLRKIRNISRTKFFNILASFQNHQPENCIIICSEPRAGSTWLMEVFQQIPRSRAIWEPFHVTKGPIDPLLNLGWRPYIPEHLEHPALEKTIDKLLQGKLNNGWTLHNTTMKEMLQTNQLILKTVRAGMLLPWLTHRYTFKHKPVLLLRHPVSTCISQLGTFAYNTTPTLYHPPDCIYNDRFVQHTRYINSLPTALERQVALWCIQNPDTLTNNNSSKWITVFYENLLLNPEFEFNRLFHEMNIDLSWDSLQSQIHKASKSDYKNTFRSDKTDQITKWKEQTDQVMLKRVQEILDYFQCTHYRAEEMLPVNSTEMH